MKLKRFNDFMLNEAKKPETIKLEKEATAHIKKLIAKKPMTRYDMVKAIEDKIGDEKIAQSVANIFVSDKDIKTSKKDKKVYYSYEEITDEKKDEKKDKKKITKFDKFETKDDKDDEKKDDEKKDDKEKDNLKFGSPEWREKYQKKGKKSKSSKKKEKEVKESKISRFNTFEALIPAGEAKKVAQKDMNLVKPGKRNLNFAKDSTKQLKTKLKSDKYREYIADIQDELDKRKNK